MLVALLISILVAPKRQSPWRATVHAVGVGEAGGHRKRGKTKRRRTMGTVGAPTTASGDLPSWLHGSPRGQPTPDRNGARASGARLTSQ